MQEIADEEVVRRFLTSINCLDEPEDILGKANTFDIPCVARKEIRHSNILAWLLDPGGSHGLGSLFLRTFLQKVSAAGADSLRLLSANIDSFIVLREYKHIDLLLVSRDPSNKIVIAIENKVDSGEHDNQLSRYEHAIESDFDGYLKEYVFLSPDGMDSSSINMQLGVADKLKKTFSLPEKALAEGWVWKTIHKFAARLKADRDGDASFDQEQIDQFMAKVVGEITAYEAKALANRTADEAQS